MTVQLSPLIHIEVVVHDADEAAACLKRVFGAEKTQLEFAESLSSPDGKVIHVDLGAVIQFIEQLTKEELWAEHLRTNGPGVHNLTYVVNDVKEAAQLLGKEGAPTLLEMHFEWSQLAPDLARSDPLPVVMMSGEEMIGFRLELSENPAKGYALVTPP